MRDYYKEIDEVLQDYESHKVYPTRKIEWAADRIDWCWKFRKITKEQMEELADRATEIFNSL